jgi:hypothetical protein
MEYYSIIRKNKLLINTGRWINLKNMVLSERNQKQKYYMYDYMKYLKKANQIKWWPSFG